jgi:diamine N-acetyltransferase
VESQRKKGYGSRLMEEIYKIAKNNGIDLIELDYWFENNIAKDFYKKHGFTEYRGFVYKKL